MTYYRTYTSKEDILIQQFRKISQQLVTEAQKDLEQALCSYFFWFLKYEKLAGALTQADLMSLVIECFSGFTDYLHITFHQVSRNITQARYAVSYESGGLFSILIRWLREGAVESPEEMAEITLNIMKGE